MDRGRARSSNLSRSGEKVLLEDNMSLFISGKVVSDNGTQFVSRTMEEFCKGLNIQQIFSLVEHPHTNGLAEAANKVVSIGLKKRLDNAKGRWSEEVAQVLWSYHTTPHLTTQETPFKLVYGSDAVIPVEIGELTIRTEGLPS